jgi:hypothetical protein
MATSPEFLKAVQDLDDQALQGLRDRAAKSQTSTDAFTSKASELMGAIHADGLSESTGGDEADKQKPVAINGVDAQGGNGPAT